MTDKKFAWVALLHYDTAYFLGAIMLAFSLKKVKTKYDTVIMVTNDVPEQQIHALKKIYTRVIPIEYINIDKKLIKNYEESRFKDVFTKLQCLKLTEYEKIIMIDIDILVTKNMDHLFELNPPAAAIRSKMIPHGKVIPKELFIKNNQLIGGINAGVMLLKPEVAEYEAILKDITTEQDRFIQFKNPEQDYLSLRYAGKWTNLDFKYNYQIGLTDRIKLFKYTIHDAYCLHYSWRIKPWDLVQGKERKEKIENRIKENKIDFVYYDKWLDEYEKALKKFKKHGIDLDTLYKKRE